MARKIMKGLTFTIALLLILNIAVPSFAQGDVIAKMGKKLIRGLVNCATGWWEIPKNVYDTSVEHNPLMGITLGTLKGAGWTVVRTGAGAYDIATFLFPIPADYEPILEPEFVFTE